MGKTMTMTRIIAPTRMMKQEAMLTDDMRYNIVSFSLPIPTR